MSGTPRIALALGGGSARGLAHILMLEAFDELGIKPSIIAGTSMGSICGAAYAAGLSAFEIRAEFEALLRNRTTFFGRIAGKLRGELATFWNFRSPSIIDNTTLFEMLLRRRCTAISPSLKIPFVAVATDFYGIQQVVLDHGPLIPALAASCSLPGLSRPVALEGRLLIDGGYINPGALRRRHAARRPHSGGGRHRRSRSAAPTPGARHVRPADGATQILFHSITREKLKSVAPIFSSARRSAASTPWTISTCRDPGAAEPAKADLKRQLAKALEQAYESA
jgi:NTE family protein